MRNERVEKIEFTVNKKHLKSFLTYKQFQFSEMFGSRKEVLMLLPITMTKLPHKYLFLLK